MFRVLISEMVGMIEIYLAINRNGALVFDLKLIFTEFLISFIVFLQL